MAGITNTIQSLDTYCPNLLLIQLGHFYQIKMLLPTPCILPIWLCPHYSEHQWCTEDIRVADPRGSCHSGPAGRALVWQLGISGFLVLTPSYKIKQPWESLQISPRGHLFYL